MKVKSEEVEETGNGDGALCNVIGDLDNLSHEIALLSLEEEAKDVNVSLCPKKEEIERGPTPAPREFFNSRKSCQPYKIQNNRRSNEEHPFYNNVQGDVSVAGSFHSRPSSTQLLLSGGGAQLSPVIPTSVYNDNLEFPNFDGIELELETASKELNVDDFDLETFVKDFPVVPLEQDEKQIMEIILDLDGENRNSISECSSSSNNSRRNSVSSDLGSSLSPGSSFSPVSINSPPSIPNVDNGESDSGFEEINILRQQSGKSASHGYKILVENNIVNQSIVYPLRPILPKVKPVPEIPANTEHEQNIRRLPSRIFTSRKKLLDDFDTGERDKLHKKILRLSNKPGGLGIVDSEGKNYLHSYILNKVEMHAVYFVHILELWLNKDPGKSSSKLSGIENIKSFIDAKDTFGRTPLFYCTILKLHRIAAVLLECGGNPNIAEDTTGDTPLHWACQRGKAFMNIVTILSTCPAINIDQPNRKGQRALHQAIKNHQIIHVDEELGSRETVDSEPVIEQLLRAGAKLSVQDEQGKTPLHWVVQTGHLEILNLLRNFSTDMQEAINLQDKNGFTVLHEAVRSSHPYEEKQKMARELVCCGVDSSIKDKNRLKASFT